MNQERDLPLEVFKPHVQIYAIVESNYGDYELIGHGFLAIVTDQIDQETVNYLEVESVKDSELLLRSRLKVGNNFEKQRGSVIVWNDCTQKNYYDLALSFEGDKQCDIFWRLICQKVGKNYLEINGRESLDLPSETNLPYILDKTKTAKDMVEYYLLNCPSFAVALCSVFKKFQAKNDKMGMGMVGRIVKSIFSNVDYRMVQALFKDPTFDLLLQVQKFLHDIDFPKWWSESLRIKSLIPLNEQLNVKILIIHRLAFYRQNILDLIKEGYLQHILVMTQVEFSKEIVTHLTKESTLDELVKLTYQPSQNNPVLNKKDIADEETFLSETEDIKKQQFAQKKLQFLLQSLIISKQMQCDKAQARFFDKIFKCGVMQMATEYLDRGILKALDFFNCLAQLAPFKFIQYLKGIFRERPSDNLHSKLSKKYCLGTQQMQNSILQLVKNFAESFKNKQNLDFFMGTFFATVFGTCKQKKAVLNVVSEIQNILENIQTFFSQAIKSKVFEKLVVFMRNQRQDKFSELRAVKILKRVLLENADSSWSFKKVFLKGLNEEMIKSGFFDYCMTVLEKNLRFNNILSSSMLENLKIIRQTKRFTPYHKEIQQNYVSSEHLAPYLKAILEVKEEKQEEGIDRPFFLAIQQEKQQEKQQEYLLSEGPELPKEEPEKSKTEKPKETIEKEVYNPVQNDDKKEREQLQCLKRIKRQISAEEKQKEEDVQKLSMPSKKIKRDVEVPIRIEFDLKFDLTGEPDK